MSNLEEHEVSKMKIVFNATFASNIKDQAKHVCMLQGFTKDVKTEAEQRINSRFIMYVP